jgi:hypothetical protein
MIFNIALLLEMKWGKIVYLWEVAHGGMIRGNSLTSERSPPHRLSMFYKLKVSFHPITHFSTPRVLVEKFTPIRNK